VRVEKQNLGARPKGLISFDFRFLQGEAINPVSRHGRLGGQPCNYCVVPARVGPNARAAGSGLGRGDQRAFYGRRRYQHAVSHRRPPGASRHHGLGPEFAGSDSALLAITPGYFGTIALGARGDDVLRLIARQAATVISIGLVLGLAGSFALTRSSNPRSSE
jgi:hypothetical protein